MARQAARVFPVVPFALVALVAVCGAGELDAQQPAPAPAGEVAPRGGSGDANGSAGASDLIRALGPEDAATCNWLAHAADELRRGRGLPKRGVLDPMAVGMVGYVATADGFAVATGELTRASAPWVLYAFPGHAPADARCVFCLASDGRLLAAANTRGYAGHAAPDATAATGIDSKGTFADVLRGPGKGMDGQFWQPVEMFARQRVIVTLRDAAGRPLPRRRVAFVPMRALDGRWVALPDHAPLAEHALPAADVALDEAGRGELRGIAAKGLCACVRQDDLTVVLAPAAVRVTADGVELTLDPDAVRRARADANESAAMATLKNISSAQAQCQASGVIDVNGNGAGEYGFFGELSGRIGVRKDAAGGTGDRKIVPPVLSAAFANVQGARVMRSGYVFQLFLPAADGTAVAEAETGGGAGRAIDGKRAEVLWCCYAWPVEPGVSGQRAFFVDQNGDVLASDNADGRYAGPSKPPAPDAARDAAGTGRMDGAGAANTTGKDGQRWSPKA